ncbi:unnamed protein product [Cladocopium goreaui]|uniref:Ubiquitin-like domain-containing protein n=1 Tax=Cladocopium goreaui TaxID=2562237 RepID=A0A9P1FX47_9DINO|nr:unnamed protein product [Cladocopium goreaui]
MAAPEKTGGSVTEECVDSASPTSLGAPMELNIMRLSGDETLLTVPQDLKLYDFKTLLAEHGILDERLQVEFLLDGVPLQQNPEMTLMELGVDGSCPLMVVKKRGYDYSRITKFEHEVLSERWPQGVLTTQEGLLHVCHFQGELMVFSPELVLVSKQILPREVVNPSQMQMAPNGDLVFACSRTGGATAAVVDPKTMEVKRFLNAPGVVGAEGGRGLGLALRGGIVYLSYGGRLSDGEKRGCVVALDFETGEVVQTFRGFAKPTGLCVANDQLLVSDRGANEVRIMTLEGEDVHTIGQGQLKYPNDVAVDSCGNILVMDTGNERVAVFSPRGQLMASVLQGTFKDRGNTHSYISVNPLTGAISVSMDDIHKVAILCPPISSG